MRLLPSPPNHAHPPRKRRQRRWRTIRSRRQTIPRTGSLATHPRATSVLLRPQIGMAPRPRRIKGFITTFVLQVTPPPPHLSLYIGPGPIPGRVQPQPTPGFLQYLRTSAASGLTPRPTLNPGLQPLISNRSFVPHFLHSLRYLIALHLLSSIAMLLSIHNPSLLFEIIFDIYVA